LRAIQDSVFCLNGSGEVMQRSVAHEEDPFSLEVDLNDVPRRKKFLA
jgi:hypothetical protein